jgi:HAD superfamily hydrolase (TIGR01509 family)
MSRLRAIIFDFNGVIIDDEPLHCRATAAALRERGLFLSEEAYYASYLGLNDRSVFSKALSLDPSCPSQSAELRTVIRRKEEHYRRELEGHLVIFPGIPELIRELSQEVPLAIASGARASEIDYVLAKGGLAPYFSAIASSDEITNGKPSPDVFLAAFRHLRSRVPSLGDLLARECAVVEDAPNGVIAAHAAGMRTLGVMTTACRERLKEAEHVVDRLAGLSFTRLAEVLGFDA